MYNKITVLKKINKNKFVNSFLDSKSLLLYAVVIIALSVTWSSLKIIQKNFELQKQITEIQQKVDIQNQINKNQQLKNQYYKSDAYLDIAARKYFGKASPGENVIVIPKDVASSYVQPAKASENTDKKTTKSNQPQIIHNWQSWINFFLHREQNLD
jgi:cell division protein FtsL